MYIFELNKDKIDKCIKDHEYVFICYYDNECMVSNFMIGMFNSLKKKIVKEAVFIISDKTNDSCENLEYPKISIYHHQRLIYSRSGFFSYKKILKEIS